MLRVRPCQLRLGCRRRRRLALLLTLAVVPIPALKANHTQAFDISSTTAHATKSKKRRSPTAGS